MTAATVVELTAVAEPETINLNLATEIVEDALMALTELDGDPVGLTRAEVAEQNRRLLQLADSLQLASTLVRNEYWHARGGASYDL